MIVARIVAMREGMLRRRVTKAMVSLCESSVVVGLVYREVKLGTG